MRLGVLMSRLRDRRTIDTIAPIAMPLLAFLAALLTAYLSGCTGPAYGASAEANHFVANAIRFVPDEGAGPGTVHLQLAGVDLEQNRFALRLLGEPLDAGDAAGLLTFDTEVARLDFATTGAGHGSGKLHFTALKPGTTRVDWAPGQAGAPDDAARRVGGILVVE